MITNFHVNIDSSGEPTCDQVVYLGFFLGGM